MRRCGKRARGSSRLSFAKYPELRTTAVEITRLHGVQYVANTEGTEIRIDEHLAYVRARATAQAPDGMMLRDALVLHSNVPGAMRVKWRRRGPSTAMAENVVALSKAPIGEG